MPTTEHRGSPPIFDVAGPIPLGTTTLIEASAGTGKTYALAAITVRLVAEHDVPIDQILIVTFTRAATAELRNRIRQRLVEAELHLRGPRPVEPVPDPVLSALDESTAGNPCTDAEREQRRLRLARAVTDFDTATVSTIHGFCSQVRSSMGVLSDHSVEATTAESETDLVVQVCADLYFRELSRHDQNPFGTRGLDKFVELVKKARTLSDSRIAAASNSEQDLFTAELVVEAKGEVDKRLRLKGGQSFDSLLVTVRDALRKDHRLVRALRSQFPVALIDEFQDTDPVQWEIFQILFDGALVEGAHRGTGVDEEPTPDTDTDTEDDADTDAEVGFDDNNSSDDPGAPVRRGPVPATLFLVGDPKQAIYAFRGGDVYTYLDASERARITALATNQRSDTAVVDAMNALARDHRYGDAKIAYQQVEASPRNLGRHAVDSSGRALAGLVVRTLEPVSGGGINTDVASVRRAIAADLATVVHGLVSSVRVVGIDPADTTESKPVKPGDVAVLVSAVSDARPVADALRRAGIPVVLRLRDDVADSDAREQWRTLLHALDRPGSVTRAAAAALTWFFGWDADRVTRAIDAASPSDDDAHALVELQHLLADWNSILTEHGIAALFGEARRTQSLVSRLLGSASGERDLTDLEHLAELIHAEARERGRGLTPGTALSILDALGGTPDDEVAADAAQRRVESDADAVQIMTVHSAKGLEFPFVLLPSMWSGGNRVKANRPYVYFDEDAGGRVIDISSPNDATGKKRTGKALPPEEKAAGARAKRENCGDQHRLTYVALTRAKHQTIAWWAPTDAQTKLTGLTRMLLGQPHTPADEAVDVPRDAASAIAERINSSGAGDAVELVVLDSDVAADPTDLPVLVDDAGAAPDPDALHELKLDRPLDRAGRVWSFSSLSRDLHVAVPLFQAGDPSQDHGDDRSTHDEPPGQDRADAGPDISELEPTSDQNGGWLLTSPYDRLGGGKDFGNLVHHLLELVDFTADPLEPTLADLLRAPSGHPVTDVQRDELPTVLADVIRTPLGSDFHDLRLLDLAPQDRLNELGFHFSLAPESPISAGLIGSVVADHLPADDPLQRWAAALASGLSGIQLHGFLNGSIDLTLRQQVDGSTRYSVVDYKTNNLAPGIASPLLAHYRRPRLLQAMADNQYALQALIYSVALHRYLGWRLADYDPAVHLGPVGYLFVRGMVGAGTPTEMVGSHTYRAGVFSWQVPHELVVAMSALFAGDRELTTT